jgi:hypothetical protein
MDAGDIFEAAGEFLGFIGDVVSDNPKAALWIILIVIAISFAVYYFCF